MPLRAQSARVETKASNLQAYRDPEVVSHYAALDYLTACERLLFDTYIKPGMAILDIGVGGGRTTPYLSRKAARYVGVDYSEEMVQSCRRKFPELEFLVSDASDLSGFSDASFDAIVIAFNGLDCVSPEERRWQCLRECARVLRAGGVLIFSSHNPRSILVRPAWDRERLRAFAGNWFRSGAFSFRQRCGRSQERSDCIHFCAPLPNPPDGCCGACPSQHFGGAKATCSILPTGAG